MATSSYAATSVGARDDEDQDMSGADERRMVLPGDDLTDHITSIVNSHASKGAGSTVRLGAGLEQVGERVLVTKAGRLGYKAPNRFFVLSGGRRYVPCIGDTVIGIVTDRNAEFYRVKLNATTAAILPVLAFDGATKHNKPSLEVGSPVFARVAACSRYFECELSCQVLSGPKKDWMTGESVFGGLRGGTIIKASLTLCRRLLSPTCAVLAALGRSLPFELAVGLNGFVYVQANAVDHTVAICNSIEKSEFLTDTQAQLLVDRILSVINA